MLALTNLVGFASQGELTPLSSLTFVRSQNYENTAAIDLSAFDIEDGDFMVLIWHAENDTTYVAPAGWPLIGFLDDAVDMAASSRIMNGTETGVTVSDEGGWLNVCILHFRGNVKILSATPAGWQGVATSGNPGNQTINAQNGVAPVLVIASYTCDGASDAGDRAMTPTETATIQVSAFDMVDYLIFNTNPVVTNCDIGDRGAFTGMQSFYVSLA
jgi:hypothetical protein